MKGGNKKMVIIKPFCKKKGKPISEKIVKSIPKKVIRLPRPVKSVGLKKIY